MTCQVCSGAIPDGAKVEGHTALCAEVVRLECAQLRSALHRVLIAADHLRADSGDFAAGELLNYADGFVESRKPKSVTPQSARAREKG